MSDMRMEECQVPEGDSGHPGARVGSMCAIAVPDIMRTRRSHGVVRGRPRRIYLPDSGSAASDPGK